MNDVLQFAIVTAAAVAAMVTLVWPYVRRRRSLDPSAPCANCQVSKREAASGAPATRRNRSV